MHTLRPIIIWLFLLLLVPALAAPPPAWLGTENLAPNGDFEETGLDNLPANWTVQIFGEKTGAAVGSDSTVHLSGGHALKLGALASGVTIVATSPRIAVEGGAPYLIALAFRQEGFNATGEAATYGGVSAYVTLQWLNGNRAVGQPLSIGLPYGPSKWDIRDEFDQAPAEANALQLTCHLNNGSLARGGKNIPSTLWLDALQVRRYTPPPTPAWATAETAFAVEGTTVGIDQRVMAWFPASDDFFRGFRGGEWSEVVTDPQAERGSALRAKTAASTGIVVESSAANAPRVAPGLYRVRLRVKMPATEPGTTVGDLTIYSQFEGRRLLLPLIARPDNATRFAVIEADFILRPAAGGYWHLVLHTPGKTPWLIDSLKVVCLQELTDRQLMTIYPGSEGDLPADLKSAKFRPVVGGPRKPMKGFVVAGLGYERYRIADVFHMLHRDAVLKVAWAKTGLGGINYTGLPDDPRDYFQYQIIFLSNVSLRGMTLKNKYALYEYVKRGGALVVLGGQQAYERGSWHGSLLEEALPVEVPAEATGNLVMTPQGEPLRLNPQVSWLTEISAASTPRVYLLHTATVKPQGTVVAWAGNRPFLVTGDCGEGRVVCLLGVPWGDPQGTDTAFWNWDDWTYLFREACWWAMKKPTELTKDNTDGLE
ncbi:MAG TPA: glutamine amidotransferase [Armatimonadota bacterium]|jgi:hypothetical protein